MKLNEDILVDVLAYLKGEATDEQIEKLRLWLAENEENKKTYRDAAEAYYLTDYAQNWDQINVFKAKRDINAKLIRKKKFPYWSVAASIVLIVGLSMSLFFIDFKQETKLAEISQIEHGQKGAELILSNGQTLQVMNTQKLLKEQNGSLVEIDSLKGLVYDNSLSKGSKLIYNTIRVARGQEFNLQLADGTKVWLNAESELRYPVVFLENNRKVFLKGEAYFEVAHNKKKAFVVNSFDQDLKVYGTKFNINAYDKNLIKTVLVEGSVGVKINRLNKEKKMIPDDLLLANMIDGKLSSRQVDVYPYIAWKDGRMVFDNQSLQNIMTELSRWYNIDIYFEDNEVKDLRFTIDIEKYENFNEVLNLFKEMDKVGFEINESKIVVTKTNGL